MAHPKSIKFAEFPVFHQKECYTVNDKPDTDLSVIWADNSSANFWVEHSMYCHLPSTMLAACFTACYQTVTLPKYIHVIVKACATEHRPDMAEATKYECLWYTDSYWWHPRKKREFCLIKILALWGLSVPLVRSELSFSASLPVHPEMMLCSWWDVKNHKLTN